MSVALDRSRAVPARARPRLGRPTAGQLVGIVVVAVALGALVFEVPLRRTSVTGFVDRLALYRVVAAVAFGVPGAVLASKHPRNVLGWLWLAVGGLNALSVFAEGYGLSGVYHEWSLPGAPWSLWVGEWSAFAGYWLVPTLLLLLFPDGTPPSRRWRPVAALAVVASVLITAGWALQPYEDSDITTHPAGYLSPAPTWDGYLALMTIGVALGLCAAVASLASLVVRYRRSTGAERDQVKWVGVGAAATALLLVASPVTPVIGAWVLALAWVPLPVCVVVAVHQHRLWDIDLVINRSLVFAAMSVGVVSVYVVVVVALGDALGRTTGAPLLATALVAVGIQPLRARVERVANALVYGDPEDPAAVLRSLSERLSGAAGATAALDDAVESLRRALRLSYVAVTADGGVLAASGVAAADVDGSALVYGGGQIGTLLAAAPDGVIAPATARVLRDVSGPLALVVRAHLLDLDLRRSRERLVVAREEERRRLRRDLHDGLGPTLAAMALQVDRGGALAARDPAAAQRLLAELARQIRSAVGSVRTITDDLRVPELDDLGLVGALQELAARFSTDELAVEVTLGDGDLVDVPAAAEAAVYRIAAEATTNAARHAGAGRCRITLGRTGDDVLLEITDDGRGIGDGAAGIGLGSMRDRAEQLGGTLTVRSLGGGGTTVAATIPVGAP